MKKSIFFVMALFSVVLLSNCEQQDAGSNKDKIESDFKKTSVYGSTEAYGEHLVTIMACNDCHTPKKMGPNGMEIDSTLLLSGHPAKMPLFEVDRKAMAAKGLVVTQDLTAWVGPWGVSYTANLTPDETGIGNWNIDQFKMAIRQGKFHGMGNGRPLLPPMPWDMYKHASDDELSAVFAYLKSIKPISNLVPAPEPPAR